MMMFSKASTETIPLKKPKNPETILSNMVCQRKIFKYDDIFYMLKKGPEKCC